MGEAGNWCLIESDPGVFTEMLQGFGVKGLQVEELYSLDEDKSLLKPVYGLIFLFKWEKSTETYGTPVTGETNIFFAQQVIENACATQAIINMLCNINEKDVDIGTILKEYKDFSTEFDPASRGLCLSNSESIRKVHNSFSRPNFYELDVKGESSQDNYHFVTYLPIGNKVYELDGLQMHPIDVGDIPEGTEWLDVVRPVIQKRIEDYSAGEIHFNLMAVIPNRVQRYQEMLQELLDANSDPIQVDKIEETQRALIDEEYKIDMFKKENARRRHNYLPFLVELMRLLAKEGKLVGLVDKAITQAKERAGLMPSDKTVLELKRKQ